MKLGDERGPRSWRRRLCCGRRQKKGKKTDDGFEDAKDAKRGLRFGLCKRGDYERRTDRSLEFHRSQTSVFWKHRGLCCCCGGEESRESREQERGKGSGRRAAEKANSDCSAAGDQRKVWGS